MHAFCRNAIHFELLYGGFLLSIVQTLYTCMQTVIRISFRFKGYIILQDTDIRFPIKDN